MKKLIVLGLLVSTLIGCAWLKDQKLNVDACRQDVACWAEAVAQAREVGQKAGDIASLSPIPASANIAKSVFGYGALIVFLALGGRKLRKKDESNP